MLEYSIVVPVYNEEKLIKTTYLKLKKVIDSFVKEEEYELIFVNDGSFDKTKEILEEICRDDVNVKLINFSRNFGQEMAMKAGLKMAYAKAIITIDADLQDPPEIIIEMIKKWREGYLIVHGKRLKRKGETFFKKITSKIYHRLLKSISGMKIELDTGNFRLIDRKVCNIINETNDHHRYLRGLSTWVGFKQTSIEFDCSERMFGETKYSLKTLVRLAIDGIILFSSKPLTFFWCFGLLLLLTSLVMFFSVLTYEIFRNDFNVTHIIFNLILCLISMIFIGFGVVGEYISKIYDEVKGFSPYIVMDTVNFKNVKRTKTKS